MDHEKGKAWWQLLLFCAVVLAVPAIAVRQPPPRTPFDATPLHQLQATHPEHVFIGDSMLYTRIDTNEFARLTGRPVILFKDDASASARWYLFFKNYVAASGVRPKVVCIFFRDRFLTSPTLRTQGKYADRMQAVMHEDEPLYERLANGHAAGGRFERLIEQTYPIQRWGKWAHQEVESAAFQVVTRHEENLRFSINSLFAISNLRFDVGGDFSDEAEEQAQPFAADPARSFLPHFIQLAKEHQIPLCFVRVKRRPDANNVRPQPPELEQYAADLRRFLEANHCRFIDDTGDAQLTLAMYADGDHLAAAAMPEYTRLFHQKLTRLLP